MIPLVMAFSLIGLLVEYFIHIIVSVTVSHGLRALIQGFVLGYNFMGLLKEEKNVNEHIKPKLAIGVGN